MKFLGDIYKVIRYNQSLFLILLFLSSCIDVIAYSYFESILKGGYIFLHHYIICFILIILIGIIKNKLFKIIVCLLILISSIIDFTCNYLYGCTFGIDIAAIIMGTNIGEVGEFVETYFDVSYVISFLLALTVIILSLTVIRKIRLSNEIVKFMIPLFYIALFLCYNSRNWGNVSLGKYYTFITSSNIPDLNEYQTHVDIIQNGGESPQKIVLIIGESFSKRHSSLYGYEMNTNPRLESLWKDSMLVVYDSIYAPASHTLEAFKHIMSTFDNKQEKEWYECLTLPYIFAQIDYKTIWISSQSQKGFFDNVATSFSEICDTAIFVGNRFAGMHNNNLDEEVLPAIDSIKDSNKSLYIIHLMGSHNEFRNRYPDSFQKFKKTNYLAALEHQRDILAAYDNSILYNDSVVSEIIERFKDEDALVLYFPDHSIDVFDTNDNYVGHAIEGNLDSYKVGTEIPFMIYVSSQFKDEHKKEWESIKNNTTKSFNTTNLIYSLLDLSNVDFIDHVAVKDYSLFK